MDGAGREARACGVLVVRGMAGGELMCGRGGDRCARARSRCECDSAAAEL